MEQRTKQQNKALHMYLEHLAQELNDAGLDMRTVLKPEVEIPWSKETAKLHLWHPIQKVLLPHTVDPEGVPSTTFLEKREVDKVYEVINRHISKHGIHVPFPSQDIYEED
jgi:hypothetical protein